MARVRFGARGTLALQLAAVVLSLIALRARWPTFHDFVVAIDHGDLAFADFVHHYFPTVADGLRRGAPAGGFFYPAGFAAMIAPLGLLPLGAATAAWSVVLGASLGVLLFVLVPRAAEGRPLLAALGAVLTMTSVPVLHDVKWGQVSMPILAAAGAAFVLHRTRPNAAAALLGVAAGIKGYPVVFVLWFLLRGDLRFALRASAACVVTLVVLPALVMGPSHALFVQRVSTGAVLGAADGVLRDFNSQYAPAVLARYEGGWDAAAADVRAMGELGAFAALAVTAMLVVVAARSTAPSIAKRRDMIGLVLVASTVPFWLRTSWAHYFVHLPVAATLLTSIAAEQRRPRDVLVLAVLVAPSAVLASVLGLFATEGWWYYANAGSLFFADALVVLALATFVVEAHVREGASLLRWQLSPRLIAHQK